MKNKTLRWLIINSTFTFCVTIFVNTFLMLYLYYQKIIDSYNFLTTSGWLVSFLVALLIATPLGWIVGCILPSTWEKIFKWYDNKRKKTPSKSINIIRWFIVNITWSLVLSALINTVFFAYVCYILKISDYTLSNWFARQVVSWITSISTGIFFGYYIPLLFNKWFEKIDSNSKKEHSDKD